MHNQVRVGYPTDEVNFPQDVIMAVDAYSRRPGRFRLNAINYAMASAADRNDGEGLPECG